MLSRADSRRNSTRVKHENSERWLLTYADLITLLLAFFVIMYGMSSADATKFSRLAESMRKAFNVDVLQGMPGVSILEQQMDMSAVNIGAEDISTDDLMSMKILYGQLNRFIEQQGLSDKVNIEMRPEGVAISISGNMLFASGRAELRPDSIQLLHSLGQGLSQMSNPIRVEGHTDDVSPDGTDYPTNWELSGARSVSVVRHLAEAEGIAPSRLAAVAFSEYHPVAPNDSPRARARNRRSEIVILYPTPSPTPSVKPTPAGDGQTITLDRKVIDGAANR
jgi:chemotaxis protein MotB